MEVWNKRINHIDSTLITDGRLMDFCAQMDRSWKMFLKIKRKYINKTQKIYCWLYFYKIHYLKNATYVGGNGKKFIKITLAY